MGTQTGRSIRIVGRFGIADLRDSCSVLTIAELIPRSRMNCERGSVM